MKSKTIFTCAGCSTEHPRWEGQCRGCGEWNTLEERVTAPSMPSGGMSARPAATAISSQDISSLAATPLARHDTGIGELDRVLGGGLVPGSMILLAGEPGIGKSTLTLQLAASIAAALGTVLLASGEESAQQIALRATRTSRAHKELRLVAGTDIDAILATAEVERPKLLIVDSVQVMASNVSNSSPGSVPQIRAVAESLMRFAKTTGTPVVLIGHVTKDGEVAGPRVLEHLVDVVLTLEGDRYRDMRLLRTMKNRFGATSEVGVFEMTETGLAEVANPSEAFLAERADKPIGSCITATMEGTRPLLVEVQALTSATAFGYPRRTASGFDLNRLNLLIAVLERHASVRLDSSDVFVNIVGGMRLSEPAADLAVALAIASSKAKTPLPVDLVTWGELGLSGEIRHVTQAERRRTEAKKLGLKQSVDEKTIAAAVKKYLGKR